MAAYDPRKWGCQVSIICNMAIRESLSIVIYVMIDKAFKYKGHPMKHIVILHPCIVITSPLRLFALQIRIFAREFVHICYSVELFLASCKLGTQMNRFYLCQILICFLLKPGAIVILGQVSL